MSKDEFDDAGLDTEGIIPSEEKDEEYSYLYPNKDDPNFNIKIVSKKEFHDTKYDDEIHDVTKHGEDICTEKEFEFTLNTRIKSGINISSELPLFLHNNKFIDIWYF